jgi:hypothetical protein
MKRTAFLYGFQMVPTSNVWFIAEDDLKNEQSVWLSGYEKQNGCQNASTILKPDNVSNLQVMRYKIAAKNNLVLGCQV